MLQRLTIKNYAIIDDLDIAFANNLNIITGETGAGKSIVIGALSLILGERADSKSLFRQEGKCVIEGHFDIRAYEGLKDFFTENDLDFDEHTTLRREISLDGKSRAFVNDTPVNLSLLKTLGEQLVDIHSQHETIALNAEAFQLLVIDGFCQHKAVLSEYSSNYSRYKKLSSTLEELKSRSATAKAETDYLQFQYNELEQAKLQAEEQEGLEAELVQLTHAEEIKTKLSQATYLFDESETSINSQLKELSISLSSIEKFGEQFAQLSSRLKSSIIELKDIAAEIDNINERTFVNEERMLQVQERLNLIYNLQQKHRVGSIAELLTLQQQFEQQLQGNFSMDEEIIRLEQELGALKTGLSDLATTLSAQRNKIAPSIESQVQELLTLLGMPHAVLQIELTALEEGQFNTKGIDKIKFLFSANKGYPLVDLSKTASGGELSRLMFVLKGLTAQYTAMPTIIFDEIDTGVSGEVALKMGTMMRQFAQSQQVLSITHLPQIAGKGQTHYFVYKEVKEGHTFTNIRELMAEERIQEIAKMIGGNTPGEAAVQSAKELLSC